MAIADAQRSGREPVRSEDETMKTVWERVLLNTRTLGWIVFSAGVVGVLHLFSEPFSRWTLALFSVELPPQRTGHPAAPRRIRYRASEKEPKRKQERADGQQD